MSSAERKGRVINHKWYCGCQPPKLAVHFKSKHGKIEHRRGQWFRTCSKHKDDPTRCKFYLWDDEAEDREKALREKGLDTEPDWRFETIPTTPSGATRTPSRPLPTTPSRPPQRAPLPPPAYTPKAGPSAQGTKRGSEAVDEDDFGLDQGDDEELAQALITAETPRKAARTDQFTTPARRTLPWQSGTHRTGLETPRTDRQALENPFMKKITAAGSTPSKGKEPATPSSSFETPSSSQCGLGGSQKSAEVDYYAHDVTELLEEANIQLDEAVGQRLNALLWKHANRARGLEKSRNIARSEAGAREAKVEELSFRVKTLEKELEAEKRKVEYAEWKLENGGEEL
ncbi:hypothetical protein BS50DRAFT_199570 [Corynespora cassiicola Philippines]|uniref:GRF-type domain-containing protein n=1 Tax=Corynespora cassiicola Philippines TaxID=1448308 RepID=A0A2T2N5X8_CORCC|nr:hypothetical protein BS50DRAFT_199570 [Corynespora cassiicola Philippines]